MPRFSFRRPPRIPQPNLCASNGPLAITLRHVTGLQYLGDIAFPPSCEAESSVEGAVAVRRTLLGPETLTFAYRVYSITLWRRVRVPAGS